MIRINLLPFRAARKQENIRRQVSVFILSLVLVTILLVMGHIFLQNKIEALNLDIKNTKDQVAKFNKINAEIAQIKKDLQILKKKTEVIQSLDTNRTAPVMLMDAMTQLTIPKRMWFTSFESKTKSIMVNGIALDNKTVADFMTNLEDSGKYQEVKLSSIRQIVIAEKNLKSFGITFQKIGETTEALEGKKK
ncbi:MAG: pilus assembly protein PilN [Desulfobacteraceae bacterium]|nr:pilus assembly protein PilN [Desulfobacteraceae bacterium]